MHDTSVVVRIDIDGRRIPDEGVILRGQLERGIDISIGSRKHHESRIEVVGWERQKKGAVDGHLRSHAVEVLKSGLPERVPRAALGTVPEGKERRGQVDLHNVYLHVAGKVRDTSYPGDVGHTQKGVTDRAGVRRLHFCTGSKT